VAYRLYLADAINYGLGQPMRLSLRDILYPPKEVDVETATEKIIKATGITLEK
jgi:hypothetical protein